MLLFGILTLFYLGLLIDPEPLDYELVDNFDLVFKLMVRFTGALVRANGNDETAFLFEQECFVPEETRQLGRHLQQVGSS